MATSKLQKPINEEHKCTQKITEVTAWGSRVFGHKPQEHQAVAKHCTTCQCSAPINTKLTCSHTQKKEHANTVVVKDMKSGACTETKKKEKEEHGSTVHKDVKHTSCIELKKKEKQPTTNVQTKDSKQPAGADMKKKDKKEQHAKSNTNNACNTLIKKEHKDEPTNHCFSSMADHWKEKIMMVKKAKEAKSKDSSSCSSDSDSEDESCGAIKTDKKQSQGTKTSSK